MKIFYLTRNIYYLLVLVIFFGCNTKPSNTKVQQSYVNQIDSLMMTSYERGLFNGNVVVAKSDIIIYQKSFGFSDESQQIDLNENSIFNIGSIAKEFNGVAMMILDERGLLDIDDTVSEFNLGLPDWSEKVTIRHLLNYASGIPRIDPSNPSSDKEAWGILKNSDSLLFEPGTDFLYDNSNVFLQRKIIEKITSQSFEEFVIENIVEPLGMTNSVFDPKEDFKNRTSCYDFDNVRCPEMSFIRGWLWVDINDLYKWIQAMNSNVLISRESFQTLLKNPYANEKTSSLGEYFEEDGLQRHNGISYRFESIFLNDFNNDITIILLSNNRNRVWDLGHTIHDLMLGKDFEIPKKSIYQAIRKESVNNVNGAIKTYYTLKEYSENIYSFQNPSELNRLGYELLRLGKNSEAIEIFKLATKEFPKDANLFDSLGEAYYTDKQFDLALSSYTKAISLGGTKGNAAKMVDRIKNENIK